MLIVALNNSVLSTMTSSSFSVPITWLSLAGSTIVFNKTNKLVTFQRTNDKFYNLTKRKFAQILKLPNTGPFYEVTNEQVAHKFNKMGYQPPLTGNSHFCKTTLPCIWNFLFRIFLCCLTGRSTGIDKAKLEVYAMIVGLYYNLNVNYVTQLWEEFEIGISHTNVTNGVWCARYWSLILREVYEKDGISVPSEDAKMEFSTYKSPKVVSDDPVLFSAVAQILDAMLRKVDPAYPILVHYLTTINLNVQVRALFPNGVEGTSRVVKVYKKPKKPEQPKQFLCK